MQEKIAALKANIQSVVLGKSGPVDLMLTTLLAGGHLLLEDVPGIGKTLLARALAKSLDGLFHRIQFTSDLILIRQIKRVLENGDICMIYLVPCIIHFGLWIMLLIVVFPGAFE